jgi:quinol-cytochrome oxidoreductase complex cytochrome b subunit
MGPKADPLTTPEHIKPEWYFFWAFRWLKLMPESAAVITQGIFVGLLVFWPFVDGLIRKRRPESEASVWIGAGAVAFLLGLTVWEALSLLH